MSQVDRNKSGFWRSFEELAESDSHQRFLEREFQEDASVMDTSVSRRSFMKLMGASAALAGVAGCGIRKPVETVRPYVKRPEDHVPGHSVYYATAMQLGEDAVGVLAETHEGRPTKLEGNPGHSRSMGALTAFHQASVLGLYDPDRLKVPHRRSDVDGQLIGADWSGFESELADVLARAAKKQGRGMAILTETQISPTYYRVLSQLQRQYPQLRVYRYDPVSRDTLTEGLRSVTGQYISPDYDFSKADIVVSFDADFLGVFPGSLPYSKAFSERRDPDVGDMNRFYMFETSFSVTGAKADHRLQLKSNQIEPALWVLASKLLKKLGRSAMPMSIRSLVDRGAARYHDVVDAAVVSALESDLLSHKGRSLLLAGPRQPASVHALIHLLNTFLGNVGKTITYRPLNYASQAHNRQSSMGAISKLASDLDKGYVDQLFILGGNPLYNAPADLNLAEHFSKAEFRVHLSLYNNETSAVCDWVLPKAHYLEAWGDLKAIDGTVSLVQPVIQPLYDGRSDIEFLSVLKGKFEAGYDLLRATWRRQVSIAFESKWKEWLHTGVVWQNAVSLKSLPMAHFSLKRLLKNALSVERSSERIELNLLPSYSVYDGRFANNGWLQELPDPISKLTWDNALFMSVHTAEQLNVESEDVLRVSVSDRQIDVPVMVVPGHADQSFSLSLGYGRKQGGRVAQGAGVNAYEVLISASPFHLGAVSVEKTGEKYTLASTQNHGSMEDREIIREGDISTYEKHPSFAKDMVHTMPLRSLWDEKKYDTGYQWGMAIDLSRCTSCNACVTACQSENNIPIVGKEQVLEGREMHWIRIDRYFGGDAAKPSMLTQPMTCMQCENAPCEQVCPVAATVHSEEGLNDMVYNRCIGTRYCSNNCPVKVRRFNFYDFHQTNPQSVDKDRKHLFDYMKTPDPQVQKQFNPNVTVRMRGVMEKCTFCVQRINEARVQAKNEERSIEDLEVVTACQQTCPSDAIVFGNILDKKSAVNRVKEKNRDYHLLTELYLKPRTSFLASIRNPNPLLVTEKKEDDHGHHH